MIPARAPHPESIGIDDLLSKLEGVRRTGEGRWLSKCPGHGDKRASLSVKEGDDGRILLHDFAGCEIGAICAALGLEVVQLFPRTDEPWQPRPPKPDPDRRARALFERLCRLREPPPPERMRAELLTFGRLLLAGSRARPTNIDQIQTFPIRLIALAIEELYRQGTPRRWYSPLAIAHVLDWYGEWWGGAKSGCYAREHQVFTFCQMAVRMAAIRMTARSGADGNDSARYRRVQACAGGPRTPGAAAFGADHAA